jgi:hypothetical protein
MPPSSRPEAVRSRARRAAATSPERDRARERVRDRYRTNRENELARVRDRDRVRIVRDQNKQGLPLTTIPNLRPSPILTPWRSAPCEYCGALLLQAESATWCCKGGAKILPPLPPLPPRIAALAASRPKQLSEHSRELNYLFCFSAIGASQHFSRYKGVGTLCASH